MGFSHGCVGQDLLSLKVNYMLEPFGQAGLTCNQCLHRMDNDAWFLRVDGWIHAICQ
jgi:hypothetical protein